MKKPTFQFFQISTLLIAFLSVAAFFSSTLASDRMRIEILHPSIGETVDSLQNNHYDIFGRIAGLSAGRLYQTGDREYQLHLIRNRENRAQILILDVTLEELTDIKNKLSARIQDGENQPTDGPVFNIEESDWSEKYLTKKVELTDGNTILCTLVKARNDTLFIRTWGGLLIPIPDADISEISELRRELSQGKWIRVDPNQSRLFFAPTGRPLKAGTGYFADYWIFFPTMAYGLTDYLSISGGISLIPGADKQLFYFAPKITTSVSPKLGLSAGCMTLSVPGEIGFTLGYAVTTFGSNTTGITIGTGIPLNRNPDINSILLIGGETQLSNKLKLISENWIFIGDDQFTLFSGGIRFFSDKIAVDLALFTNQELLSEGGLPFFPWVDFAVFFGR